MSSSPFTSTVDSKLYRLKASTVRLQCRTRRQCHRQVHIRFESNVVTRFALRRIHAQLARCSINRHVHETVESNRYAIGRYAVRSQRSGQVAETAMVGLSVSVDDAESVPATGGQEEVVSAHRVLDDAQHHVAAVRVQRVACGEVDAAGVVEGASGGNDFVEVVGVEGEQIGDLSTPGIDDFQPLALLHREGFA